MHDTEKNQPFFNGSGSPYLNRLFEDLPTYSDQRFADLRFNAAHLMSVLTMTRIILEQDAWAYYSSGYHTHKPAGSFGPFPHYDQARQGTMLFALCKLSDKMNPVETDKNEQLKQTCYAFWKMRAETDPFGCVLRVNESSAFVQLLKSSHRYLYQVAEQYAKRLCEDLDRILEQVQDSRSITEKIESANLQKQGTNAKDHIRSEKEKEGITL